MIKEIAEMNKLSFAIQGIAPFEKNYNFYFDETNNIRKFKLKPENEIKVNSTEGLKADFILGGICFKDVPDTSELFAFYSKEGIVGELKSKHLFRYSSFLENFKSNRISTLLNWLNSNQNVFLHYTIENNYYMGLVDIVDSLFFDSNDMIDMSFELKDALYRACKVYQDDILELLCQYNYPDIEKDTLTEFIQKLSKIIKKAISNNDPYLQLLYKKMTSNDSIEEMPFITENEPLILQKDFASTYMNRIATFFDSNLVFDEEKDIISIFDKSNILNELPNCKFVVSTTDKFVQISDCVIACISKTLQFMDSLDIYEIEHIEIDQNALNNLRILHTLIYRSDSKNRLLIQNLNAWSLTQLRMKKLKLICQYDK